MGKSYKKAKKYSPYLFNDCATLSVEGSSEGNDNL